MKFLGIALLVAVCIFIAVVEGRRDHKRAARKEHDHGVRRDERRKMMLEAQQTKKANIGEPLAINDASARKERAKLRASSKDDAKFDALMAEKAKRGHNRHGPFHKRREDEAKPHDNHAHGMHRDEIHKRHHDKRGHMHSNDVRGMKKQKFNHDMLEDMAHIDPRQFKRMMKKMAGKGKPFRRMNDSRAQMGKGKTP